MAASPHSLICLIVDFLVTFILLYPSKQFKQYLPNVDDGFQFHPFACGVRLHDTRTDAGDLDARIVLNEESSFEHKVHGYHSGTPTKHILERIADQSEEGRLLILLPCWSLHDNLRICTNRLKYMGNILAEPVHICINETACMR